MMFQEYVNREEQKYLKESLMKYENEKPMMPDERAKLHEWVVLDMTLIIPGRYPWVKL